MLKKVLSLLGAVFLAVGLSAVSPIGANAAAQITAALPAGGVADGATVNIPITFTGVTFPTVRVHITATNGTLTADYSSVSSAVVTPGFESTDSGTAFSAAEISFSASKADAATILAHHFSFTSTGTAGTSIKPEFAISVSEFGVSVDPGTGHTYVYSGILDDAYKQLAWDAAEAHAETTSRAGHAGYLTVITTTSENDFIKNKSGVQNVWIGATDDPTQVAAINVAKGLPAYVPTSATSQTDGHMVWAGGTEKGNVISDGLLTPTAPVNGYQNWSTNEPNNWHGIEGCGVTNWGSTNGLWNDLTCSNTNYYMIEYDTSLSDAPVAVTYDSANDVLPVTGGDLSQLLQLAAAGLVLVLAGAAMQRKARNNA